MKPFCTISGCTCTPRVKEYKQRVVEEVDTKCHLLYVKYQCTGANKIFFSTVSSAYLQREEVMELVQEGMLSPHGLTSTVDNMKRRREKRYYMLLSLFADRVRQNQLGNPTYMAPNPPIIAQYCSKQNPIGPDTLSAAWLQISQIWSSVCEVMMRRLQVKKVLRIDHSVKFCKRLKNEIGQIIGRRLPRSENNKETRALFEHVKSVVHTDTGGEEQFVVSDNANAVRSMVSDVFGAGVGVRQDLFHVVQRFTEKVKDKVEKTLLAKRLHDSIYDVDGCLRSPAQMSERIKEAVGSVSSRHLNCSDHEWMGTLNNNLEQWGQLFETARVDSAMLEVNLHQSHQHSRNIKELLSRQAVFSTTSRLPKASFFNSLRLSQLDYEAAAGFSLEELALLRQLRREQAKAAGQHELRVNHLPNDQVSLGKQLKTGQPKLAESWAECPLVTPIMYNVVVGSNLNKKLNLRRRSYATLAPKISKKESHQTNKQSFVGTRGLFHFESQGMVDDGATGHEQAFQIDLFTALRQMAKFPRK
ncbi:hypothetical protein F442_19991 [Phytophthora nicotianae P10297]|uniref:Uncharacterized protein n=1 Tax=Phytophthora nicotianae P10297 TaxID=1317064 RepID=W2Y8T3_PHYNI|nr:hypothetical protein F442_19991 [Phytophthora nicotianae P10297]